MGTQKMKTFIFLATVVVLTAYSSPVPNPKPQIYFDFDYSQDCYGSQCQQNNNGGGGYNNYDYEYYGGQNNNYGGGRGRFGRNGGGIGGGGFGRNGGGIGGGGTHKTVKDPNVNRILEQEKFTATSSQIAFGTEEETGETENIDDVILILSSNTIKLFGIKFYKKKKKKKQKS